MLPIVRATRAGWACALFVALIAPFAAEAAAGSHASVVPRPKSTIAGPGTFRWPGVARISTNVPHSLEVRALVDVLHRHGIAATISGDRQRGVIAFHVDRALRRPPEGYGLRIDGRGVIIDAAASAGAFYATTTLDQLIAGRAARATSPEIRIEDAPAYRWRGIHLDVSRHFFPPAVLKRYVAIAARYKLNRFHLHLSDDRAWRMEIERHPALTRRDAFYTQAQLRELVAYAAGMFVTIVPEIDVPAHSTAALRAVPGLAGSPGTFAATGTSYRFIEDVLDEVLATFPGRYVHVGGDEAPPGLASVFAKRLDRFARSRGRRIVAWDDIVDAGAPPDATLMVWRNGARGAPSLLGAHDVVLAPDGPLYFDAYQGDRAQEPPATKHMATLEQVYEYRPPVGPRILGIQANLWTERIASERHLFYMLLPRALALAEVAWTPPQALQWSDFMRRLPPHLTRLAADGYPFRVPSPIFTVTGGALRFHSVAGHEQSATGVTDAARIHVHLQAPVDAEIHYTLDGSLPNRKAAQYRTPFQLALLRGTRIRIRAAAFTAGARSTASECSLERAVISRKPRARSGSQTWSGIVSP